MRKLWSLEIKEKWFSANGQAKSLEMDTWEAKVGRFTAQPHYSKSCNYL